MKVSQNSRRYIVSHSLKNKMKKKNGTEISRILFRYKLTFTRLKYCQKF